MVMASSAPVRAATRGLRHTFLVCAPGLERSLERELQTLRLPGRFETSSGGVLVTGPIESLWRGALQSRVAESARLRLCDPFYAPDVRALDKGLEAAPWEDYLSFGDESDGRGEGHFEMPLIRVTSEKSRLYHTRLIEERVAAAVESRRLQWADTQSPVQKNGVPDAAVSSSDSSLESEAAVGKRPEWRHRDPSLRPAVSVHLRHDECQVSVVASSPLHLRGYRKTVGEAPLKETLASACVQATPLLRRLAVAEHTDEELVLWDPFCGSGVLLLEALATVLGHPPGIGRGEVLRQHPFSSFPCHDENDYAAAAGRLQDEARTNALQPSAVARLTLLGTDRCAKQVESAQKNLRRFLRRLPGSKTFRGAVDAEGDPIAGTGGSAEDATSEPCAQEPSLPCQVRFEEGSMAKTARALAGRPTMILTNVPYGVLSGAGDTSRRSKRRGRGSPTELVDAGGTGPDALDAYAQLGRLLKRPGGDWRGVYCLATTNGAKEFQQHTGLEWKTEERFLNGSRWVDLLQWTGGSHARSERGRGRGVSW